MKFPLLFLLFFLLGCSTSLPQASHFNAAETRQYHIIDSNGADSLVIGEYQQPKQWRWLQINALGVPLARQVYQQGSWRNDGFLPPNSQARVLFTAIMLADEFGDFPEVVKNAEGGGRQFIHHNKLWLDVSSSGDNHLFLQTFNGSWQMRRLNP